MLYVQLTQPGFVAWPLLLISLDLWSLSHHGFTLHYLSLCNEELKKWSCQSIQFLFPVATEVAAVKLQILQGWLFFIHIYLWFILRRRLKIFWVKCLPGTESCRSRSKPNTKFTTVWEHSAVKILWDSGSINHTLFVLRGTQQEKGYPEDDTLLYQINVFIWYNYYPLGLP